ncbi:MAG: RluA family pseudouridine synthase [Myxococcota bacterium]
MTERLRQARAERSLFLTVEPPDSGRRLDAFVAQAAPKLSRARAQALIAAGHVRLDGETARASHRLKGTEHITVTVPLNPPSQLQAQELPLTVLYEDAWIVVLNKPAGMVVHPGAGRPDGTLVNALLHRYPDLPRGNAGRPGLVHRLDKDTSGVLVCARTEEAHQTLSDAFRLRQVHKLYRVFCLGHPPRHFVCRTGHRRHPVHRKRFTTRGCAPLPPPFCHPESVPSPSLRTSLSDNKRRAKDPCWSLPRTSIRGRDDKSTNRGFGEILPRRARRACPEAWRRDDREGSSPVGIRLAHTEFTRLCQGGGVSELQARIFTGRTHQIRAHLADVGHPVLQDTLYGGGKAAARLPAGPVATAVETLTRQALHAAELAFTHPATGKPCHFHAPLSPDLQALHEALVDQEEKGTDRSL